MKEQIQEQRMLLVGKCKLCNQIILPDRQSPFNALLLLRYEMCPSCRQHVPRETMTWELYRRRWRQFVRKVNRQGNWDGQRPNA